MAERRVRQLYRINDLNINEINGILLRITDRLDKIQGDRGTPEFYSNMDVKNNRISNVGQATQESDALVNKLGNTIEISAENLQVKYNPLKAVTESITGLEVNTNHEYAIDYDVDGKLKILTDSSKAIAIDSSLGLQVVADRTKAISIDSTLGLQIITDSSKAMTIDASLGLQVLADNTKGMAIDSSLGLQVLVKDSGGLSFDTGELYVDTDYVFIDADQINLDTTGFTGSIPISADNVQLAMDALDIHTHSHSDLTDLTIPDDHTQYALLAGRLAQTLKLTTLQAYDSNGLSINDDAGGLGIFVQDGGKVGIFTNSIASSYEMLISKSSSIADASIYTTYIAGTYTGTLSVNAAGVGIGVSAVNNAVQDGKTLSIYSATFSASNPNGYLCNSLISLASGASCAHTSGTVGTAIGIQGYVSLNGAGGTITNAYGGNFSVSQVNGTITNAYGVYIGNCSGSTVWGLYQAGTDDDNYFAGKVGINVTPTLAKLQIDGSTTIQGLYVSVNIVGTYAATIFNDQVSAAHSLLVQTDGTGSGTAALYVKTGTYDPIFACYGDRVSCYSNFCIGTNLFGTSATRTLSILTGTSPTAVLADGSMLFSKDVNAAAGKASLHMIAESGTSPLVVVGTIIKTDTGDPAQVHEGLMVINTADNKISLYADGAWRQLASW